MFRITLLFIVFTLLFSTPAECQVTFSNTDCLLRTVEDKDGNGLLCTGASVALRFATTGRSVSVESNNLVFVDSQLIQITPLLVSGLPKKQEDMNLAEQKQLLTDYAIYEMDYFSKELKIEVINPQNQWVPVNARHWFIWYHRVGNAPVDVGRKVIIQLFATTLFNGVLVTINAPIFADSDFTKAARIVNQLMESMSAHTGG